MNNTLARVAMALLIDYSSVYYIDLKTGHYECYSTNQGYQKLELQSSGEDFFTDSQRDIQTVIYPDDWDMVSAALTRETLLRQFRENDAISFVYRLMIGGRPVYHTMRILHDATGGEDCMILGVLNVDESVRAEQNTKTYNAIAKTLANRYATIYYVDMLTDRYLEFSSTDVYKSLEVRPEGDDFFAESIANIGRVIYPEDREGVLRILNKPTMIQMLHGKHMITHTYRLLIGEGFMYARLSIIWATDNKHLIIGVMNIDQEVRKEKEVQEKLNVATEKAYRDEMTGVRNKGAYQEYEAKLQEAIDAGASHEFAIVVCDVNGLKAINDRVGHIAGDRYIKSACDLICHTWSHSPVFRVGGDEFVVVAQGENYRTRHELLARMKRQVEENKCSGAVVIAAGMSDYRPGEDRTAAAVFERADNLMYENKALLKGGRA